jgi:hypothetical protein
VFFCVWLLVKFLTSLDSDRGGGRRASEAIEGLWRDERQVSIEPNFEQLGKVWCSRVQPMLFANFNNFSGRLGRKTKETLE